MNSVNGETTPESGIRVRPPSGFTDSREFSETECDRDRALDLEVQRVLENSEHTPSSEQSGKFEQDELTSLLAR